MARRTFPDEGSRLVYSISGVALRGSVSTQMRVYSDSGASSLADIQTTGGATIAGSVLTVDSGSQLPLFLGPNDDSDTLYVRKADGTGSITTIYARTDDRVDTLEAAAATAIPQAIPGRLAWYDASQITGLSDGNPVSSWADLSGNGRTASQATSDNQPTYQTNELNGLPVVRFDGTNDWLKTSTATLVAQPITVFVVATLSGSAVAYLFDGSGGSNRVAAYRGASSTVEAFAGTALAASSQTFPQTAVWAFTYNGSSSTIRRNGAQVTSGNAGSTGFTGLTFGARFNLSQDFLSGDLAEVLVFSSLDAYEIQRVEDYLAGKWGTGDRYARKLSISDRGLWVSTTGDDDNDGLSGGAAMATVQAAVTAIASAGGGVVNVLGGNHDGSAGTTAGELIVPQNSTRRIRIVGQSSSSASAGQGTVIRWTSDLGSGKFAIRSSNANARTFLTLEDLTIVGPGTSFTLGTSPAVMDGVQMSQRMVFKDCVITRFHAGVKVVGDHNRMERCSLGACHYGLYFNDMHTYGDLISLDNDYSGNMKASVGVGTTGQILGTAFFRGHLGFSPYSVYLESGMDPDDLLAMGSVLFYNVSFEAAGNGHIISEDLTAKCEDVVLQSCGDWSQYDSSAISGEDSPALIQVGTMRRWQFLNTFPQDAGDRNSTVGIIVANTLEQNNFDQGNVKSKILAWEELGIPPFKVKGALSNAWRDGIRHGFVTKAHDSSGGISAKQVVGWSTSSDHDYLYPYATAWSGSADAQVAGVALTSGPANSSSTLQNAVAVQSEGTEVSVSTTLSTPSGGTHLMVDPSDRNKVTTSDGRLDLPLLGFASGHQGEAVSGTCCNIDLHLPRTWGVRRKTVTGSRGGNAALASLLTQLAALGIITDSSS